jgi:hypothetical protein
MKVSIEEHVKKGTLNQQKLVLKISGEKINHKFINCLRRLSKLSVPTYAFYLFNFVENTSVHNNDMMKLRFMQITPPDLDVKIDYLDPIYELQSFNNYDESRRQRHENDKINYEFHINIENKNSETYINVTTDDMKFYSNKKIVKSPQPPLLITHLRKGDKLVCNGKAILGTGLGPKIKEYRPNEIWAASGNTYYEELHNYENPKLIESLENELKREKNNGDVGKLTKKLSEERSKIKSIEGYKLTIESKGQFSEFDILRKCCKIALHKLGLLKKLIEKESSEDDKEKTKLELIIEDDDSIESVLVYELQQLKNDVVYASCARKEAPYYESLIKVESKKKNVMDLIIENISVVKSTFIEFEKQLNKLKS